MNWIITWIDSETDEWTGGVEFEGTLSQAEDWALNEDSITGKYKIEEAAE